MEAGRLWLLEWSKMMQLKKGDEIRVIAPSRSLDVTNYKREYTRAQKRLESLGYIVTFGKSIEAVLHFGTATKEDRANDFNDAYRDKNVKLVMALSGGWSANEILPLIDWEAVVANPIPLIGFSDITVLINALYVKAGVSCFLGPNFSTIGRMPEWRYTLRAFNAAMQAVPTLLQKSDRWAEYGQRRYKTTAWKTFTIGEVEALALGGNLGTFYLLQGTPYQPCFKEPFIFLLEDDDEAGEYTAREVSRRFESLLQLPGFRQNLKGLVIGRFQKGSAVKPRDIESILQSKNLGQIPIVYNVDFGHTLPMVTIPIGKKIILKAKKDTVTIII
ncbi:LD-carboxypeptidase [Candidatus Saccharibacteria bacterium]|jgi:muramoyltetrapeptide carboxypeptidase|nr:LD-carboxypeptidase [Candidatus Saccharibacteria bacterium]